MTILRQIVRKTEKYSRKDRPKSFILLCITLLEDICYLVLVNPRIVRVVETLPFDEQLVSTAIFSLLYYLLYTKHNPTYFNQLIFIKTPLYLFSTWIVRQLVKRYFQVGPYGVNFEYFLLSSFIEATVEFSFQTLNSYCVTNWKLYFSWLYFLIIFG